MSESWKDSARGAINKTHVEVIANGDGTFEIILNQRVVGSRVPERWLNDEVCGKYGFCGEEFASIKRQLDECGRAVLVI